MKILLLIVLGLCALSQGRLRPRPPPAPVPSSLKSNNDDYYDRYGEIQGNTDTELVCEGGEFRCKDGSGCVDEMYHCDKISDCIDDTDEQNCTYFQCGDGRHVNQRFVCDGVVDCYDGHDEDYENGNCTVITCMTSSSVSKVYGGHVCDGVNDCQDDVISDECNCSFTFVCDNKKCINLNLKCDGNDDCRDGSDEVGCAKFDCNNGNAVLRHNQCDGIDQCGDSSDECNCTNAFVCNNGRCIAGENVCNGIDDCDDTSDECVCSNVYKCANNRCIPQYLVENSIDDCGDNSDEVKPTTMKYDVTTTIVPDVTTTEIGKFRCSDGKEIDVRLRCNGNNDCGDVMSSDECSCNGVVHCEVMGDKCVPEVECNSKCGGMKCVGKCLGENRICDKIQHCDDNKDEANCTYKCTSGKEINLNQVCDGFNQCENNEDECGCDDSTFRCANGNCIKSEDKCTGNDACGDCSGDVMCKNKGNKGTWYRKTSCPSEQDCHVTWSLLSCGPEHSTPLTPAPRDSSDVMMKGDEVTKENGGHTIRPSYVFVFCVLIGCRLLSKLF